MILICLAQRMFACGIDCGMFAPSTEFSFLQSVSVACISTKARLFLHLHSLFYNLDAITFFFQCFRNWLGAAKSLALPEEAKAFCLDTIEEDISILEKELPGAHQRIGFCHNDLQYGNIMIDEVTNSITIIVSPSMLVI